MLCTLLCTLLSAIVYFAISFSVTFHCSENALRAQFLQYTWTGFGKYTVFSPNYPFYSRYIVILCILLY